MTLNISILPLNVLDNLAYQKCLLPHTLFPKETKPGSWAKCIWTSNEVSENFSICQIFSKDEELQHDEFCYLDTIVGSRKSFETPESLTMIQILEDKKIVKSIEVIVELEEDIFIKNYKRFTREYLEIIVQHLLQSLHFTLDSFIATEELKKWGIAHIQILQANEMETHHVFTIDDETTITYKDIKISSKNIQRPEKYLKESFGNVLDELKEFFQTIRKQDDSFRAVLPSNALVVGPSGCGKSTLIQVLINELNCNCFHVNANYVMGQYPGDTERKLRQIFEAAQSFVETYKPETFQLIVLEDLHILCPSKQNNSEDALNSARICCQLINLIDDLRKNNSEIICFASTLSLEEINSRALSPGRLDRNFILTLPNEDLRYNLLNEVLKSYQEDFNNLQVPHEIIDFMAKRTQGYVIADLQLLVQNIVREFVNKENSDIVQICKDVLYRFKPYSMQSLDITVVKPTEGFETIAGMDILKRDLETCLLSALKNQEAYHRFGLKIPKGLLLYGPPGCGKTKFAKCLAYESNMTFIITSGAEVYSPYVGEAEKFLAKVFDTARRHAPCLIFFDEIDTMVGKRTISEGNSGDVQLRLLTTMLTEMDGILHASSSAFLDSNLANDIIVVGATNRPDMLDEALTRPGRFDKLIHVPPPDYECRHQLLSMQSKTSPFAKDVDIDYLANNTMNFSSADIKNLVNEAALNALQKNIEAEEITMTDFEEVLANLKPSLTQDQIDQYETIMQGF